MIHGYLLRYVGDPHRAEDLLQVTFLRLHAARNAWMRGARVVPWTVRIARNAACDEYRARRTARVVLTQSGHLPELAWEPDPDPLDSHTTECIHRALNRLPPMYREAVTLTKHRDLTIREAAVIAGATESAMKLRLHRAYNWLRQDLGGDPDAADDHA
jgi:RNA polymerase sigma-70 factor (ECF subfamily)